MHRSFLVRPMAVRIAALTAVMALVAACSGGGSFTGGGPGVPGASIGFLQPRPSGVVLLPPPGGGINPLPGAVNPQPGSGSGGVPAWATPGMRVSWYSAAASVAQSRYAWVEDAGGPWEDPKTGKHYRRTDEAGGTGQPGASGDGISQIDVVAVEGSDVVLSSNLYVIDRSSTQARFTLAPGVGARVPGASVDGAWIHPSVLAQLLTQDIGGVLTLRGPYQINGTTYSAVSFVSNAGTAYTSYTYDAQTGVLLSATTSTAGATSPFSAPGENAPVGNTQLTITRFLGMRQRAVPGIGAANPNWVGNGATFQYGGVYQWVNPVDPSSGALQYPMQHVVTFGTGGGTWLSYQARNVVQGGLGEQPGQNGVTSAIGRYWWDPQALASMRQGQVLDQDPLTGEQVTVAAVGQGGGGPVVTIDDAIPGVYQRMVYDGNGGQLISYDIQVASSGTQVHLQLQGGH